MRYKQATTILLEILESPGVPTSARFKIVDLILKTALPQLGPYKKRSVNQVLWRMASDSARPWRERWHAIRLLLDAHSGVKKPPRPCANKQEQPRAGGVVR
jgi:hypothetical protein